MSGGEGGVVWVGLWGCWGGSYLLCGSLSSGPGSAAPVGGWKSASAWAGLGTEARPRGHGAPALHVGFRRREGSLGSWYMSVRDIEKEENGLNECTWADSGCFFPLDFQI